MTVWGTINHNAEKDGWSVVSFKIVYGVLIRLPLIGIATLMYRIGDMLCWIAGHNGREWY